VLTAARIASSESLLDMPLRYMDIHKEKEKNLQAGKILKKHNQKRCNSHKFK